MDEAGRFPLMKNPLRMCSQYERNEMNKNECNGGGPERRVSANQRPTHQSPNHLIVTLMFSWHLSRSFCMIGKCFHLLYKSS